MSPFSKCGCSSFLSLTAVSRASAGFQAPLVPILDSFVQWTACANCAWCLVYIYIYLPGTGDKHLSYNKFSSVSQLCPTLSTPWIAARQASLSIYQLPEFTQTHAHRVGDAIQPSHPLSSPSPPAPNPSEHQGLFQWVNSLHEVAKVLEFQLQHQSFQWTPRTDLLGWTGWISLQSKGLSRVFFNTIVQKHQFFGTQLSPQSNKLE